MLATPHTLVGIAIGAAIPNPYLAIPLSFIAHYAGDLIPHWDIYPHFPSPEEQKTWKNLLIVADILLGITLGISLTLYALWVVHKPEVALNMFLCGLTAVLPDAMYGPVFLAHSKNKLLNLNIAIQHKLHIQSDALWGNLTQWSIAIIAFLATLNSIRQ